MLALRPLSRAIALVAGLALLGGSTAGLACAWICDAGAGTGADGIVVAAGGHGCHGHARPAAGPAFAPACCRSAASSADRVGPRPATAWSMPLLPSRYRPAAAALLGPGHPLARPGLSGGPPGFSGRWPLRI